MVAATEKVADSKNSELISSRKNVVVSEFVVAQGRRIELVDVNQRVSTKTHVITM